MSEVEKHKESMIGGLLGDVATKIKDSRQDVYTRLRDAMVEKEVANRVKILDSAFQTRFEAMTNLRKTEKPDVESFNADGTVASAAFSKARLEEIKKAKEALQKIENAMEKALTDNDFSKLKEIVKV